MSGNLSDDLMKAALQFLYERRLAMAGLQAEIIITRKSENEKEKAS